jgi:uncharacterized membrane protein HdeD (DUF308 family)
MEEESKINSISCPVCQNLCSSQALFCPKCGHPFAKKEVLSNGQEFLLNPPVEWKKFIAPLAAIFSLLCFTMPFIRIYVIKTFSGLGMLFSEDDSYYLMPALFSLVAIIIVSFKLKNRQGSIIVIVSSVIGMLSLLSVISMSSVSVIASQYGMRSVSLGFGWYGAMLGCLIALLSGVWHLQREY